MGLSILAHVHVTFQSPMGRVGSTPATSSPPPATDFGLGPQKALASGERATGHISTET